MFQSYDGRSSEVRTKRWTCLSLPTVQESTTSSPILTFQTCPAKVLTFTPLPGAKVSQNCSPQ